MTQALITTQWLEKPNFHNRRAKRSGDLRKWQQEQTLPEWAELRCFALRASGGGICKHRRSLPCGYENQAHSGYY
ncbi:MAG: hypothetical protein LBR66_08520 [Candidatus Symbiothrix sp.]|nr:hypothetical protein [Candidatus Symbiothrix sp.]